MISLLHTAVILALGCASLPAEEIPFPDAVTEITKAYRRTHSYLALYRLDSGTEQWEITLGREAAPVSVFSFGRESAPGAAFIQVRAIKAGTRTLYWTQAGKDDLYMAGNEDESTVVVRGLFTESRLLHGIGDAIAPQPVAPRSAGISLQPSFLLTPGAAFHQTLTDLSARSPDRTPWSDLLEGGSVTAADAATITFHTRDAGEITLGRKHGQITRQSIQDIHGRVLVLKLHSFDSSPGSMRITQLIGARRTVGARELPPGKRIVGIRREALHGIIRRVEQGGGDLEALGKILDEKKAELRTCLAACIVKEGRTLFTDPGADLALDDLYLGDIRSTREDGARAKALLVNAFVKAYREAIADEKIAEAADASKNRNPGN